MATLKHLWVGAYVLVACVMAQGSDAGAETTSLLQDALTKPPNNSAFLQFYPQIYNQTGRRSLAVTRPAVGPNGFGQIFALGTNVTRTPDPNSTQIGTGNGQVFFNSQKFPGYENAITLTLNNNSGVLTNSSVNFEGFTPYPFVFPQPYNYTVVGGTGAFACARGVSTQSVYSSNANATAPATLTTVNEIAYIVFGCGFNPNNAFYLFFS